MKTRVVNIHYEAFDVDCRRPGRWGNPYRIGRDGDRERVIQLHMEWIQQQKTLMADLGSLRGKRLGCVCAPKRCHVDNIIILITEQFGEE